MAFSIVIVFKITSGHEEKMVSVVKSNINNTLPEKNIITPSPEVEEAILKIHGSNTIGEKLMPLLVENFLKSKGAENISINSEEADYKKIISFKLPGIEKQQKVEILSQGSSTAFQDLLEGKCDIGMSSRKIKSEEVEKFSQAGMGDLSLPSSETIVALDGVAVIVNQANGISHLSEEQLISIFKGDISDWSSVGSTRGKINIYARDYKSGTYDIFKSLVMGESEITDSAKRFESSEELSQSVAQDEGAIGFVGFSYIGGAKPLSISNGSGEGIQPSVFKIATEDYALTRRLYLYMPPSSTNTFGRELISFLSSEAGQNIAAAAGFVSQNIILEPQYIPPSNIWMRWEQQNQYKKLLKQSVGRLSVNFRFLPGNYELDNKAEKDMDRIIEFINKSEYADCKIALVGFTDNEGYYNWNLNLSGLRAKSVRDKLIGKDSTLENRIETMGMGQEQPIASNRTPLGREKNRRVEVWLVKDQ
ncbi:MAG: phosphate ABC transporter substrate-binding/OmpA family protein [Clostridia bacterium]|nr:phosphate ABC transporter substrate-binding/OmpA family protein [Clostridia bacterium]